MKGDDFPIIQVCLALVVMAFGARGCFGDAEQARRVLDNAGYSDVEVTGGAVFGCSQSDWKKTTFRADNPAGKRVSGIVCCGVFKACTVRLEQ